MRSFPSFATLSCVSACLVSGCLPAEDPQEELVSEAAIVPVPAPTYFELTDAPRGGGWFLSSLNQATTMCHDGQDAKSCYTPAFDWSEAHLSGPRQTELLDAARNGTAAGGVRAIVRGWFAPTNPTFVITEGWVEKGDAISEGEFVKVFVPPCGIVGPCSLLADEKLNTSRAAEDIADVDFSPTGLSDQQIEECRREMMTYGGILVAGYRTEDVEDRRVVKGRTATAAYVRLE